MAISGLKESNFQQIVEQPEEKYANKSQRRDENSLHQKAGGTGEADENNFEDDCIASFSDEQEDDQAFANDQNNKSLTLNQQLQRQQRFIQRGGPSTLVIGQKSLISGQKSQNALNKDQLVHSTILQGIDGLLGNTNEEFNGLQQI